MDARAYALPALAMALLTFAVWLRLFFTRIPEMKRERIHPQSIALSAQAATRLSDSRAADNFRNLFELPVLFYVALVVAAQIGMVDGVSLALSWAFVALRVAHSWIHVTYNKVMHRFAVYVAGGMVLWLLWAYLAVGLLSG